MITICEDLDILAKGIRLQDRLGKRLYEGLNIKSENEDEYGIKKELIAEEDRPYYIYRKELWSNEAGIEPIEMESGYSSIDGSYIGDLKTAKMLAKKGITAQLRDDRHGSCSIGKSDKDNKWYGWSHRGIFGFKPGSKVKKGDCAFQPDGKEAFIEDAKNFWIQDYLKDISTKEVTQDGQLGVEIEATYTNKVPNEKLRGIRYGQFEPYPKQWGRGEWEAKTDDDAKQMAMDYAEGVS